ncbi:hypothetical protein P7L74_11085 [Tistrella mobilis]|jgi:uncharacterized protein (DUF1778 family)|uniref:hypothetical protein n=1 Tax=Tistrella mobilis TaxID=171437 RepID=UPI003555C112
MSALKSSANRTRSDLSLRDGEAFVRALTEPQPVNDRLMDTIRRYRQRTGI